MNIDLINSMVWQERCAQITQILAAHIGKANGIGEKELIAATLNSGRTVRKCVELLRREGRQICGTPDTGYFIAETPEELNETCDWMTHRAMTTLVQVSAMKRVSLADLIGQARLPT
jgi:hypothetical protein